MATAQAGRKAMALKQTIMIFALLASLVATEATIGQVNIPSAKFSGKAVESADNTRPFASPGVFDYDTQLFAPLEFTNGKEKAPNSGFFFSLDKTYTSVDRAGIVGDNGSTVKTGSHYIWGTQYNLGWFSDDDDGWALTYHNAQGSYFTAGQDVLVSNPMLVRNEFANVEVNRIFRQTLSQGGYFEPYIGMRFMNFNDNTLEDTTQTINGTTVFNRFKQNVTNNALGLQAGGRYNVRRGRWRMTGDGAIATAYNQQRYFATDIATAASAGGNGPQAITETYQSDQAFLPVLDGQFEVAYNVSRDISLRTGFQASYVWNGVARANTQTTNLNPNSVFSSGGATGLFDESFIAAGFIFGVEWRR
ncbi:MAG: hypothetical protein AB8B55_12735 [Mariniblastus sp.]